MPETYTPPSPEDESKQDTFKDALDMQQVQERMAAQRIVEQPLAPVVPIREPLPSQNPTPDSAPDAAPNSSLSPRVRRNRAIAGGIITAGAAAFLAGAAGNAMATPEFSEETTTFTAQDGDGLYDAAEEIQGINSIDIRDAVDHIADDPANIDILKDGLQRGEKIMIPISVEGHEENH